MIKQIGYDIDGCVVDSAPFFTALLMQKYELEDIRARDKDGHEKFYFKLKDVPGEEVSELIAYAISKYHPVMREVQGAVWAISQIYCVTGDKPIYLTTRKGYPTPAHIDVLFDNWLTDRGLNMPYICKRVTRHGQKPEWAQKLGITHYVEDRYKNAHQLAEVCEKVYLMHTEYNNRPIKAPNIQRVYHWGQVVEDYLK